jgi:hypothetical protein
MQKIKKLFINIFLIKAILFFFLFVFIPYNSYAEILAPSYCELSIQSMQLEITHLNELISIMNQYLNDPQTQAEQIATKQAEYDQALTSLYESFGTTGNEYVMYLGKHDHEVAAYLETNSDIKQQMDTLTSQIETLLAQYELLKGYEGEQPPQEPPLP